MRKKLIERNTPPEWNVRVLTEDDFWTYCDAARIVVREVPLEQPGCRLVCDGKSHIFIHDRLRGVDRMYTLWHEMAHAWLHAPRTQFFLGLNKTLELEANAVAACAMIPRTMIAHYWPSEIAEEYGYPEWLIKFRETLLKYWQL